MTTTQIMEYCEVTKEDVLKYEVDHNLQPVICKKGLSIVRYFSDADTEAMIKYFEERNKELQRKLEEEKKERAKEREAKLEALRKAHPLVKDDNFFKVHYFPDIVPDCFK